jgi:hypothetical protein
VKLNQLTKALPENTHRTEKKKAHLQFPPAKRTGSLKELRGGRKGDSRKSPLLSLVPANGFRSCAWNGL